MTYITDEMIRNYYRYLIDSEKAVATVDKYIHDITVFSQWLEYRNLTKTVVLEYKKVLECNYCPTSVNTVLSALNSFFEYIGMYNLKVKTLKIQQQIFSVKDKELTKTEYRKLLSAAKKTGNEKMYLLMQTICSTGIRVSELKHITVECLKTKKALINMKGKIRIVIIPNKLCSMLLKYIKKENIQTGCIFLSKNRKPLDRTNIWRVMKSLSIIANVPTEKVFPHNLRHLFARTYYSIQRDIVRLADILGHSSVNTTRIYTMETGQWKLVIYIGSRSKAWVCLDAEQHNLNYVALYLNLYIKTPSCLSHNTLI